MISTINGGPILAGTSNNSIKHYVRSSYAHQVFSTKQGRLPKMQKSGWAAITFCEEEERGVILSHDDSLIIHTDISNFDVRHILVDTGSSVSVMFANALTSSKFLFTCSTEASPFSLVSLAMLFSLKCHSWTLCLGANEGFHFHAYATAEVPHSP
ncbi:unnamed protein product [Prunus armeniaca]